MYRPNHFHSFQLAAILHALFFTILPGSAGQNFVSLEEVTQQALGKNPRIAAARARWQMAIQRIPQESAWEDPKLNFRSLLGRFAQVPANGFTDQMVSLEQSIPISGKNRSRGRVAAAEAITAFQELRREELDLVAKARSGFFELANDYELLELNEAEATSLSQTITNARTKFEVGKAPESDILVAQIERQKTTEERQELEQKLSNDETTLKVSMNIDAFASFGRPKMQEFHAMNLDLQKLRGQLSLNNPEVLRAYAQVAAAQSRYQLAKREWIPDPAISIQADHYNAGSQLASEVSGGISVSLPWFNEQKYRAGEREALDELTAVKGALEMVKNEAIGKLRDQLQKLQTLHHHVDIYANSLIPKARQSVSATQSEYETDSASFQNLLTALRNLWEIEAAYDQHLTDYQIALADLESLLGSNLGTPARATEGSSK
jgi:cobalt-zinc-cadmium efflux system outer membrane protein